MWFYSYHSLSSLAGDSHLPRLPPNDTSSAELGTLATQMPVNRSTNVPNILLTADIGVTMTLAGNNYGMRRRNIPTGGFICSAQRLYH